MELISNCRETNDELFHISTSKIVIKLKFLLDPGGKLNLDPDGFSPHILFLLHQDGNGGFSFGTILRPVQ